MNIVSSVGPRTNYRGNILGCYINMENLRVVEAQNPIDAQDLTTKFYVDNLFNYGTPTPLPLPTATFTLTGTNSSLILSSFTGNFDLYITGTSSGSPMGSFSLIKNDISVIASITRNNSMCGTNTKERLTVTWNPNSGIYCNKNDINHDGTYTVQYRQLN